jgi:hypothetical protein
LLIKSSSGFLCAFRWIDISFNSLFRELLPLDQNEIKLRCLKEWGIPLKEESQPRSSTDATWDAFSRKRRASNYFNEDSGDVLTKRPRINPPSKRDHSFTSPVPTSDRAHQQRNFPDIKEKCVISLF